MDKKKLAIITGSLIITAGFIWVVILAVRAIGPAETGTETSNPLSGVPQTGEGEGVEQSPAPSSTPPAKRSNAELLDSIVKQKSSLSDANGQPVFAIVNAVRTPNAWYVVTIRNTKDPTVGDAKLVLKDSGNGGLVVVAGPGTRFDREDIAFPEEVWKLL